MRIKLLVLSTALSFSLVSPFSVFAEDADANVTTVSEEIAPSSNSASPVLLRGNSEKPLLNETQKAVKLELREQVKQKKEEMKATLQTERGVFKQKLANIQDAKKQAVVERIDAHIDRINDSMVDRWVDGLEQLTEFVERSSSEAAVLKASGANTAALDLAITNARSAITTAETQVSAQAEKNYVISVTTDGALKGSVGQTVSSFRQDLRNTHQVVFTAKQAVIRVVRELNQLKNVDKTPTVTVTQTPVSPSPVSTGSAGVEH